MTYIANDLKPSVISDVVVVAANGIGHHGVPRNVFCYVDHLGYLAYGDKRSTQRAVKFIREFFPGQYDALADLIYYMWRHGVVHEHKPRSLHAPVSGMPGGVTVRWVSTSHVQGRELSLHLLAFPVEKQTAEISLVMNNFRLANDLLCSIQNLETKLSADATMKAECDKRVAGLGQVRRHTEAKARSSRVETEVATAWKARGGLIDAKGNVVTPHHLEGNP